MKLLCNCKEWKLINPLVPVDLVEVLYIKIFIFGIWPQLKEISI